MGLPLLLGALRWHILLGHVLGPLGSPLPMILSILQGVFSTSCGTPRFGTCFLCPCRWLLCNCMHTAAGTHHRTGGRWHLRGLLIGFCLFLLFLRLTPALPAVTSPEGPAASLLTFPGPAGFIFSPLQCLKWEDICCPNTVTLSRHLLQLYTAS